MERFRGVEMARFSPRASYLVAISLFLHSQLTFMFAMRAYDFFGANCFSKAKAFGAHIASLLLEARSSSSWKA